MSKTPSDHALAVIKAGIAAVPMFGGSIASLIGDYVPSSTHRQVQLFVQALGERLRELEDRLDPEAVDKEEFAEMFKSAYLLVLRTHKEQKRRAATNLLANLLLRPGDPDKLSYTELDHFARSLDLLSSGALEILGKVAALRKSQAHRQFPEAYRTTVGGLASHFPEVDPSLVLGLVAELTALNLLAHPQLPSIRTENSTNVPIELTPLGNRFITHILSPGAPYSRSATTKPT